MLGSHISAGRCEVSLTLKTSAEVDGGWLPTLDLVELPPLTGSVLIEVVRRKKVTAGSLQRSGWRELKSLPAPWFDGLARILRLVETDGVWPEGLLDAHIAMIPKADGDATALGQRSLCVFPVVCGILCICWDGAVGAFV